jgi:hypothetical protein
MQYGLDELGLGRNPLVFRDELVVPLERTLDRCPRGDSVEPVKSQRVPEQVRDAHLEGIELRERVFPDTQQEVDAQAAAPQRFGQLVHERARSAFVLVVEEVLLELVEDHVDVAVESSRPSRQLVGERSTLPDCFDVVGRGGAHGVEQVGHGVAGPRREDDDERVVGSPEAMRHPGTEQRRLADAADPVEDGQARGHQVGDDHLDLALAAEEEQRVEGRVLERREPLVRTRRSRDRRGAHAEAPIASRPASRASAPT